MGIEIERKFLVVGDDWRALATSVERMEQGYLAGPPSARCSVRVRTAGGAAWLNIKSLGSGVVRDEFEYPIALDDAQRMLESMAGERVRKRRHHVPVDGHVFEIDEFEGDSAGLVVAELELASADAAFPRPPWLGAEVSLLPRYYNLRLASYPYCRWTVAEREARDAA